MSFRNFCKCYFFDMRKLLCELFYLFIGSIQLYFLQQPLLLLQWILCELMSQWNVSKLISLLFMCFSMFHMHFCLCLSELLNKLLDE